MKFIPERGDCILYKVASDGNGNALYEMGKVQAVIGKEVFLGGDLIMPIENILPCKKDAKELLEKVNSAYSSGTNVYGYNKEKDVA